MIASAKRLLACSVLAAAMTAAAVPAAPAPAAGLDVAVTQNTRTVPRWDVFEITFRHGRPYANPFWDVAVEVVFTSPSGRKVTVGGFHYGSDEAPRIALHKDARGRASVSYAFTRSDLWKARFAPDELGRWTFAWTFTNSTGETASGRGDVTCVPGRRPLHGFVRQDGANPMRWVFDDGSLYYPIGFQDGIFDNAGVGSVLAGAAMEGPFRTDRPDLPEPPPGPMFRRGPAPNPQNMDVQFRCFAACGFNLFRFSQQNFSLAISKDLDHVGVMESRMVDELLARARAYNLRIFYGLFGYMKVHTKDAGNAEAMVKVRRQIKYHVDRWGALVDFWEMLNEQHADAQWFARTVPYLKSIDPYHHPVTTSWERPELDCIDLSAPHRYVGLGEVGAGRRFAEECRRWKKAGKPVIVGETGNRIDAKRRAELIPQGIGGVWDPKSALRMRLRNWAAFFNETAVVFWNTSYARDGHYMNIWLGPKEREYIRAMQAYAYDLGPGLRMVPVTVSAPADVAAWGLASDRRAGVYLEHQKNHAVPVRGLKVTLDVPAAGTGYWYAPESAAILGTLAAAKGSATVEAPPFAVDLALLVTPDGPPDIDRDGLPNDRDPDDDNDGAPDARDAFPLDPSQWDDADGDLIGDRLDADIDADGAGDDRNGNGTPDHDELDIDGDGVPRTRAVPWDAFPLDPKEWRDTDADGVGDNADTDDDGDGWSDAEETHAGTDPLDRLSFPAR